jgi:hypothetical protein
LPASYFDILKITRPTPSMAYHRFLKRPKKPTTVRAAPTIWTGRLDLHERFLRVVAGALAKPTTTTTIKKGFVRSPWSPVGRKRKPPTVPVEQYLDEVGGKQPGGGISPDDETLLPGDQTP